MRTSTRQGNIPRAPYNPLRGDYGFAGAGAGACAGAAGAFCFSKLTLGTCRAPSSALKYASFLANPLMLATKLFGKQKAPAAPRSEEHTSELQSRQYLV